ncbi:hypothetical protein L1887_12764 [Cichorium endivia]|nr:hypothetical protein L1887_12764 [Cichorium endivia]
MGRCFYGIVWKWREGETYVDLGEIWVCEKESGRSTLDNANGDGGLASPCAPSVNGLRLIQWQRNAKTLGIASLKQILQGRNN